VLSDADAPVTRFGEIVARTLVDDETVGAERMLVGTATYPPGASIEEHSHPETEEFVLVLAGRAVHVCDGRRFELGAGQSAFIPRGAVHALEAAGDAPLEILWAYGGAASYAQAGFVTPG
jgi:quercetin dioxygenase-like cupin family protein